MQKNIYKEDQGNDFGKWDDPVSWFLYHYSIKKILDKISIPENVADYGGANGILKDHIPGIISIDIDPSKNPDIEADILKYKGDHELIIIRFVLHYLNDYEVIKLFDHINSYHKGEILIIQFCNNDLRSKYYNSRNEFKYFRTEDQMEKLLPEGFKKIFSKMIGITPEFYQNRLNISDTIPHIENINAYYYEHNN